MSGPGHGLWAIAKDHAGAFVAAGLSLIGLAVGWAIKMHYRIVAGALAGEYALKHIQEDAPVREGLIQEFRHLQGDVKRLSEREQEHYETVLTNRTEIMQHMDMMEDRISDRFDALGTLLAAALNKASK